MYIIANSSEVVLPIFIGYIGPGTAALLVQVLVAGLAGFAFFYRHLIAKPIAKVTGLFNPKENKKSKDQEHLSQSTD